MNRKTTAAAIGVSAAGAIAASRMWQALARARQPGRVPTSPPWTEREPRWHVVTINSAPGAVVPDGRLPEPLAELGDLVEVQVRPAHGDRGTALAAKLREKPPAGPAGAAARLAGRHPSQAVRSALRQSKQLLETGEVLRADSPPSTRPTPTGLPVDVAARNAPGEGRL